jgi:hypothetical protein
VKVLIFSVAGRESQVDSLRNCVLSERLSLYPVVKPSLLLVQLILPILAAIVETNLEHAFITWVVHVGYLQRLYLKLVLPELLVL